MTNALTRYRFLALLKKSLSVTIILFSGVTSFNGITGNLSL